MRTSRGQLAEVLNAELVAVFDRLAVLAASSGVDFGEPAMLGDRFVFTYSKEQDAVVRRLLEEVDGADGFWTNSVCHDGEHAIRTVGVGDPRGAGR